MSKLPIALFLLLAACGGEPAQNTAELANSAGDSSTGGTIPIPDGNEASNAQVNGSSEAGLLTAEIGPMRVRYNDALLEAVPAKIGVPPDWKREVAGTKLIAAERAELLGTAECMYGQSGMGSRCKAEQEAGLAFAMVDAPFEELQAQLTGEPRSQMTLAGRKGISWKIGAEGEGAEYILLPYRGSRTALIVRQFRTSGNPDGNAIAEVLNNLRIEE